MKSTIFQNDFNYSFIDLSCPVNDAEEKLTQIIEEYKHNSTSARYFLTKELSNFRKKIPPKWNLLINEDHAIPPNKVRVTVYNLYEHADISINLKDHPIVLKAINVGGDFMVINEPEINKDNQCIFELNGAFGESPIMIMITPGEQFASASKSFIISKTDQAIKYLQGLKIPNTNFVL